MKKNEPVLASADPTAQALDVEAEELAELMSLQLEVMAQLMAEQLQMLGEEGQTLPSSWPAPESVDPQMNWAASEPLEAVVDDPPGEAREERDLRAREVADTARAVASTVDISASAAVEAAAVRAPLSAAQIHLLLTAEMVETGSAAYNEAMMLELRGDLDRRALERAYQRVVARHEALRTAIDVGAQEQKILPVLDVDLPLVDFSEVVEEERASRLERYVETEVAREFDLETAPLVRLTLLRESAGIHRLLLVFHDLLFEGWSVGLLLRELDQLYTAQLQRRIPTLEPVLQFRDYLARMEDYSRSAQRAASEHFWCELFTGELPVLALPADRPRPQVPVHHGARLNHRLIPALRQGLENLAGHQRVTLFMVLQASFMAWVHRLAQQPRVVVAYSFSGRWFQGSENIMGHGTHYVPLLSTLDPRASFADYLAAVRDQMLEVYEHQAYPFSWLIEKLGRPSRAGEFPLAQVLMNLERTGIHPQLGTLETRLLPTPIRYATFDLHLNFTLVEDGIELDLDYSADLFDSTTVERWLEWFQNLLIGLVERPDEKVLALALLSPVEERELLAASCPRWRSAPLDSSYQGLFRDQVARTPKVVALSQGDREWTYQELAIHTRRVAAFLHGRKVGAECVVPVVAERGFEFAAALVGVLEAGAAFLAVDVAWPAARIRAVLEACEAPLLLVDDRGAEAVEAAGVAAPRADLKEVLSTPDGHRGDPTTATLPSRSSFSTPEGLAYVIFTSGSTGVPKGAMIAQRGLVNHLVMMVEELALTTQDCIAQTAAVSFDIFVWQLLTPWLVGGRVHLVDAEDGREPERLLAALEAGRVTVFQTVPSLLRALLDELEAGHGRGALAALRWLLPTGEALPKDLCHRWLDLGSGIPLINAYGPAECSDDVTLHTIDRPLPEDATSVPIGQPLGNTGVILVDAHGRLVAPGLVGEICVSGAGVGRGYLRQPARTAEVFVPDPIRDTPGARLYRSGDLGRRSSGEVLEFQGRRDQQVKVRGVRIEIGEVEAALRASDRVVDAVVIPHPGLAGEALAAYVVWAPEVAAGGAVVALEAWRALREFLRARLPEAMVPMAVQTLEALPRTSNGKLDRRSLPVFEDLPSVEVAGEEAPRTAMETLVSEVWREVLGLDSVGVHSNFFDLGGHSLLASKVVGRLRKRLGIELRLRQLFEAPTVAEFAAALPSAIVPSAIVPSAAVPEPSTVGEANGMAMPAAVEDTAFGEERLPMSDAQRQLVLQAAITRSGGVSYNEAILFRLAGPLHVEALEEALRRVVSRHETLRSAFCRETSELVVRSRLALELPRVTVASQEETRDLVDRQTHTPFDLEAPPLYRFLLIQEQPQQHLLVLVYHLAIFEGWSAGVLLKEVEEIYGALVSGRTVELPSALQYRDYLTWLEDYRTSAQAEIDEEYWLRRFADEAPVLNLPTDRPYPALMPHRGARVRRTIRGALLDDLRALARSQGVTLFMLLYAAYMSFLCRLTGQRDVVVGFVVNGRSFRDSERIMGYCAHFLPVRSWCEEGATFETFLTDVKRRLLEAYEHQDYLFAWMVEKLELKGGMERFPLFMASFNMERTVESFDLAGTRGELVAAPLKFANYAVHLNVAPWGQTLELDFDYSADLFDPMTAERWLGYFLELLNGVVAAPSRPIAHYGLQTAAERREMMDGWNDTHRDVPTDRCFFELFAEQVARSPEATAVCCGDREWSYRELHQRARAVSSVLVRAGVGPDQVVALLADRSEHFLQMILAILDAGGAWLPLDPLHPAARLHQIVESSGSGHVVVERQYLERIRGEGAEHEVAGALVVLEDLLVEADQATDPTSLPEAGPRLNPQNLAYLIYTSGSTGQPKGAMLNHAGMINHIFGKVEDLGLTDRDRVAQTASQCFDISVWQFLAPLVVGATVEVVDSRVTRDAVLQAAFLEVGTTTIYETVPVLLRALLDVFEHNGYPPLPLRWLMVTGEALPPDLASRWLEHYRDIPLINAYGPTECSDDVTHHVIDRPEARNRSTVPIGKALINTRLYMLDRAGHPTPTSVPGELTVGGAGVGRGYLGSPALTAAVFVPDPWSETLGARLYRTGDLARFLWDGTVEFLGRLDHQVKVRGFRIELGEIEAALVEHPQVHQAAAIVRDSGRKRVEKDLEIHAFVVSRPGNEEPGGREQDSVDLKGLRHHLQKRLPEYMMPSAMRMLPQLPVNASGKLDRKALPRARRIEDSGTTSPRTSAEERMVEIWQEVLGVARVGIEANFFSLGGHSLLATQVVSRLGGEVPLSLLFEVPVLADFAAEVERLPGAERVPHGTSTPKTAGPAMSNGQRTLWRAVREQPGSPVHMIPGAMRFEGVFDKNALDRALALLVVRHESLRTVFPETANGPKLEVLDGARTWTPLMDLSVETEAVGWDAFRRLQLEKARRAYDLESGPLLDTTLLKFGERDYVLVFHLSHLIADGWSVGTFIEDLQELYRATASGTMERLPALTVTTGEALARQAPDARALERELEFWRHRLGGDPPRLKGVFGQRSQGRRRGGNEYVPFLISRPLTEALAALSQRQNVTLYITFLAAIELLLGSETGQDDVVVCSSFSGRRRAELHPLIGYFVKNLPLRAQLGAERPFLELLRQVNGQVTETYDHQEIDPAEVAAGLFPEANDPRREVFSQVLFIYHNPPADTLHLPQVKISEVELDTQVSDFDLTFHLTAEDGGYRGALETQPGVFPEGSLERLSANFLSLLEAIARRPDGPQGELTGLRGGFLSSSKASASSPSAASAGSLSVAVTRDLRAPRESPLTAAQLRFWLLSQLTEHSAAFNVPLAARLRGPLDRECLAHCWQRIADRHEILRTVFVERDGEPSQRILTSASVELQATDLEPIDLEHLEPAAAEEALASLAARLAARTYDLETGPLWRVDLARLGSSHHVLFFNAHHLVCDGWSIDLLLRELSELYASRMKGRPPRLAELPMQYADFAISQAELERGAALARQLAFWKEELHDLPAELALPTDRPRPRRPSYAGANHTIFVPATVVRRLQSLAEEESASPFMVLLAGFQALLHRFSGLDDIFVGTAVAGRHRREVESLIGFFANSLVLRTDLGGRPCFREVLRRVRRTCLRAFDHQQAPFERVVEAVNPERNLGPAPLFQVMFVLQTALRGTFRLADLEVEPLEFALETSGYDLVLDVLAEEDGRLRATFEYSTELFDNTTIEGLSQRFLALLESAVGEPTRPIDLLEWQPWSTVTAPLSGAQRRLWMLQQLEPESTAYNIWGAVEIHGSLDPSVLARSLGEIVRRHEILRTTFSLLDSQPVQIVQPPWNLDLDPLDLSHLPATERMHQVRNLTRQAAQTVFDLSQLPLLRPRLVRLGDEHHAFVCVLHHLIADAVSFEILVRELTALYTAFAEGSPSPLVDRTFQYRDYAGQQERWLASSEMETGLSWWQDQLTGLEAVALRGDRPRPQQPSDRGESLEYPLPPAVAGRLRKLARRSGGTPFVPLLAAVQALLLRHGAPEEFAVGTPVANRTKEETESLIGFLVNTLVLRADLRNDPSFSDLLARTLGFALDAWDHQEVPFERLVEALAPSRQLHENPLFQVLFAYEHRQDELALPGLKLTHLPFATEESALFDLIITVEERGEGFWVEFNYLTDLFDRTTIRRLAKHFEALIQGAIEQPETCLSALPLLASGERHQLIGEWATSPAERRSFESVFALFAEQVERTPQAVAVVDAACCLTYEGLRRHVSTVAGHLRRRGVGREGVVAVCAERRVEMMVGLLAVLEAGAMCLPLDPGEPTERRAWMLQNAGTQCILAYPDSWEKMSVANLPLLSLANDDLLPVESLEEPVARPEPENGAYVMYTSGSTGRPKGVVVSQRAMASFARETAERHALGPDDRVLQFAALSFDTAVEEIFPILLSGGQLVFRAPYLPASMAALFTQCARQRITWLDLPTAYWHRLVADWREAVALPTRLRTVIIGGERAEPSAVRRWFEVAGQRIRLVNTYGPTETTVVATDSVLTTASIAARAEVPIGHPLGGVEVRVFDRALEPAAVGVVGELYLGGAGLARGYLRQSATTAERFCPDPFARLPGQRLYRTGDLVVWRAAGALEFQGRRDKQVKIQGYRVERGEVEAVFGSHPSVRQVTVQCLRRVGEEHRLTAYVVGEEAHPVDEERLRLFARAHLPVYMVPAWIVVLDEIPLTERGKVDVKALPAPETRQNSAAVGSLPSSGMEELIGDLFAGVLGRAQFGVHDNFFDLGGHSLAAIQVIARLRDLFEVELAVREVFDAPTAAALARRVRRILGAGEGAAPVAPPLDRALGGGSRPLSYSQERLWFLDQFEPASAAYNMPVVARLDGDLDEGALVRAFAAIVARHEVLQTTFHAVAGKPEQRVHPRAIGDLVQVVDLLALPEALRESFLRGELERQAWRPFDLEREPPLRVALFRLSLRKNVLLVNLHHIASDGWSMEILLREVQIFYGAFVTGEVPELPPLPVQYSDFARWQRAWLIGEVLEAELEFWRRELTDIPEVLDLSIDRPRHGRGSQRSGEWRFVIPEERALALEALAGSSGATLFMVMLGAFQTLLARWCGQRDLCVGTPIVGREEVALEGLIGFFANTLVMRSRFEGEPDTAALLKQVRATALQAYCHQGVPFEKLVEVLAPTRDLGISPLFQVMFTLEPQRESDVRLGKVDVNFLDGVGGVAKFDLSLHLSRTARGLEGGFVFRQAIFDLTTLGRLERRFSSLLQGLSEQPMRSIFDQPVLAREERHQLLVEWNDHGRGEGRNRATKGSIHRLFAEWARRTPDAVALVSGPERVTYERLLEHALELAGRLRSAGVKRGTLVALLTESSIESVVGILGILGAGGAYVPLSPTDPPGRLAAMADDLALRFVVTGQHWQTRWPDSKAQMFLAIFGPEIDRGLAPHRFELFARADDPASPIDEAAARRNRLLGQAEVSAEGFGGVEVCGDDLAYVIHTSGSTGRPKGVGVSHGNIRGLFESVEGLFHFDADDVWTLFHAVTFDFSVWELWGALIHGGRLVVVSPEERRSGEDFHRILRSERVTVLNQTPSAFQQLRQFDEIADPEARHSWCTRYLVFGGEALEMRSLEPWIERRGDRRPELINMYGITETTVHVTHRRLCRHADEEVASPVGRPLQDYEVYLLDYALETVPIGAIGELHVGGVGVARGYLNRASLTSERFVPDLWSDLPGARLYRSGDLARQRQDGSLEYFGRIDHQVKIRGFRIELGEIEAVLLCHPRILEARVLCREVRPGDQRLFAYLIPAGEVPEEGDLRKYLAARLPAYMVPAAFVVLESFPLTPHGKLDVRSLPQPEMPIGPVESPAAAPAFGLEQLVADCYAEVLGGQVGSRTNFFEAGGHSLLAIQLISRLRHRLEIDLPVKELFDAPTVSALAMRIRSHLRARGDVVRAVPPLLPAPRPADGLFPLSFAQERLWFLDQLEPGRATYNLPLAVRMEGELHPASLDRALTAMVRRHGVLRTTFEAINGQPMQRLRSPERFEISRVDFSGVPWEIREGRSAELIERLAGQSFELCHDLPVRATLLVLAPRRHVLLLTLHHIAGDGWSLDVLMHELKHSYEAFAAGFPPRLPDLPVQYTDFAVWQRNWLRGERLEEELAHWRRELSGMPDVLDLPTDRPRRELQGEEAGECTVSFPGKLVSALEALAQETGITLFMVGLAAFQGLLGRWTGQQEVCVGTPAACRDELALEGLIGFFVNTLVLRTRLDGQPSGQELLARVRKTTLTAYAHQNLPFEKLVDSLMVSRRLDVSPLFQVMFQLANERPEPARLGKVELHWVGDVDLGTKFDLSLDLVRSGEGLRGDLVFRSELFDRTTIERLLGHLRAFVEALIEAPTAPIAELGLLSSVERHQLTVEWGDATASTASAVSEGLRLPEGGLDALFRRPAECFPDRLAVVLGDGALSYGELRRRADLLAEELIARGVGPEDLVGILLDRCLEMPIALLGILAAGAAYVPLDPSHPAERLASQLRDQRWVVSRRGVGREEVISNPLWIDDIQGSRNRAPKACGGVRRGAGLAYILYTSGSTGTPKGVTVSQDAVAHLARALPRPVGGARGDGQSLKVGVNSSLTFDVAMQQITQLFYGHTLEWIPEEVRLDSRHFVHYARQHRVDGFDCTPSQLRVLLAAELGTSTADPREILVAGEAIDEDLWQRLGRRHGRFYNAYGPTECTVYSTITEIGRRTSIPTIGRAIDRMTCRVLGPGLERIVLGAWGELHIAGAGLARGYHGRPGLTAAAFLPDLYATVPGARLYRSGDRARLDAAGRFQVAGRLDGQIKIRGIRIELGDIECALLSHPNVVEGAVVSVQDDARGVQLIACVVLRGNLCREADEHPGSLRRFLETKLPAVMVPAHYATFEALPLNSSGKLDRRRLATSEAVWEALRLGASTLPVALPETETQRWLLDLWASILDRSGVGIHDDFFALGGHSLLAVQVVRRIEEHFGIALPVVALFQHPTIAALADFLETSAGQPAADVGSPLVAFGAENVGDPLFLVHPAGGQVHWYHPLAQRLKSQRRVFGLQAPGLGDAAEISNDLTTVAARYLNAIREVAPGGPLDLVGWSVGGLFAFEVARQAMANGQQTVRLGLIDSFRFQEPLKGAPGPGSWTVFERFIADLLPEEIDPSLEDALRELRELPPESRIGPGFESLQRVGLLPKDVRLRDFDRMLEVYRANLRAIDGYTPGTFAGEVALVRASASVASGLSPADASFGWQALCERPIRIYDVPGDHHSILTEGLVDSLAEALHEFFGEPEREG